MYFIQKPLKFKQVRGFSTFKNLNLVYFYFFLMTCSLAALEV